MNESSEHHHHGATWFDRTAGNAAQAGTAGTRTLTGVTWFQQQRELAVALFMGVAVIITMLATLTPAQAKPTGGVAPSGPVACADFVGGMSLADVNAGIGATAFHQSGITGAGVDVAVIDTGVAPIAGLRAIDGPDLSFDALNSSLRFGDLHGHGTNLAAIIAGNGGAAGQGVAPGARIVDVKVGAADGTVDVSQVIAAIDWVVANRNKNGMNIRVINLAYNTDAAIDYRTDPLTRAVENAWLNGIVVVIAGGNDGRAMWRLGNPAVDPFAIAVGAAELKERWKVPSWSSTGDGVRNPDLIAPGASIVSAGIAGSYLADTYPAATCVARDGSLLLRGSGTSQSAAVVSGAAALLLEQRPTMTPNQVKKLLTSSGRLLGDAKGTLFKPEMQGSGLIDLAAIRSAPTPSLVASMQYFAQATGGGSLEASRGTARVGTTGDMLVGETTAFGGAFDSGLHSLAESLGQAWKDQIWNGATWSGGTWSGATWSGATWSGATWSGATWSGATWSGATWSGATWSGATWSGATWSGATWSGATWSGATWSGATWSGATWS